MSKPKLSVAALNYIKIDKDIPMRTHHHLMKYPWRQMEVGDSFLFPEGFTPTHYYGQAREFTKQSTIDNDRKVFKTRKTADGYRCWRVA